MLRGRKQAATRPMGRVEAGSGWPMTLGPGDTSYVAKDNPDHRQLRVDGWLSE